MKKKLTVTIDEDLLPRAKRHARRRGVSLSSLIEASLRELTGELEAGSFTERWRGAMAVIEAGQDERYRALVEKYG